MGLIPSPEQSAGEGRQRRIEAHQVQALQLSLGRQAREESFSGSTNHQSRAWVSSRSQGAIKGQRGFEGVELLRGRGAKSTSMGGSCS